MLGGDMEMETTVKRLNSIAGKNLLFCWKGSDAATIESLNPSMIVIAFLVVPSEKYPCDNPETCEHDCSHCPFGKSLKIPDEQRLVPVMTRVKDVTENINSFYAIVEL